MKNDSAFPRSKTIIPGMKTIDEGATGITKREYFAAMAMQGFISAGKKQYTIDDKKMNLAKASFYIADKMLAESEKSDSDK